MLKIRSAAVIPAAGFSSRMGDLKQLLKIGNQTMVERTIGLCTEAGVDEVVVVLGHRAAEIAPVVEKTGARLLLNPDFSRGMFSSIRHGVKALAPGSEAFFLLPVDIPLVTPATLVHLADTYRTHPAIRICYPSFDNRRGHPPLIDMELTRPLLAYDGADGMRGFLRKYEDVSLEVSVEDSFITLDADTPADFEHLVRVSGKAR